MVFKRLLQHNNNIMSHLIVLHTVAAVPVSHVVRAFDLPREGCSTGDVSLSETSHAMLREDTLTPLG